MFNDAVTELIHEAEEVMKQAITAMIKVDEDSLSSEAADKLGESTRRCLEFVALTLSHALELDKLDSIYSDRVSPLIGDGNFS